MNKINNYILPLLLLLSFATQALAVEAVFSINDKYSDEEIENQISQLSSEIDMVFNQEVKTLINTYISAGRNNTELILSRSQYYFPIMEKLIKEHQLPEEIKYLAVIESGLRPKVKSHVGAVGLWQFMSGTAKEYDLRIMTSVDDRKDVRKSTEAAMLYLNDLYKRFGDWTLALAAYNCGPGNINKAIRKSGGKKDFWEIRKFLPKETKRYLPKLIATIYVMNHFREYGMSDVSSKFSDHSAFGVAHIFSKTSFDHISEFSGLSIKELQKYNPSYTQNYIPASTSGNNLIMPEGYLLTFLQNKQMMENLKDVFYLKNTIVYKPVSTKKEEIELNFREEVKVESLKIQLLEELVAPEIKIEVKQSPITVSRDLKVETYRLRKRQSLAQFIEEKGIDTASYAISVNEEGVVHLNKK